MAAKRLAACFIIASTKAPGSWAQMKRKRGLVLSRYPHIRNGVLISFSVMLTMYSNTLSSPLLTEIAADTGTPVAMAGYLPTGTTLMMGLSLILAVPITERFGLRRTMCFAAALVALGNCSALVAGSFLSLLLSRAVVGLGMGTLGTGFSTIVAAWPNPKGKSAFVTIYTLGNTIATYLCFSTAIPLYETLNHSWRNSYLLAGLISAAASLGWLFLGTDVEGDEKPSANPSGGLRCALRDRQVWILTIYHGLATLCTNVVTNYLPAYLQLERHVSRTDASSWTSVLPLAGILGTAAGGYLSARIGQRKPVILAGVILSLFSMVGVVLIPSSGLLICAIALFGFASRFRIPPTTSASTEVKPRDSVFASGSYAMMYSVGSVAGFVAPPILSFATNTHGMTFAMLIFCGLLFLALLFALFVRETRPKSSEL